VESKIRNTPTGQQRIVICSALFFTCEVFDLTERIVVCPTGPILRILIIHTSRASAVARAYNVGLGAAGVQGETPLKLTRFLCLKHFNFSMHLLRFCNWNDVFFNCFWCAYIHKFIVRICSLVIAGQHPSIIPQVQQKITVVEWI